MPDILRRLVIVAVALAISWASPEPSVTGSCTEDVALAPAALPVPPCGGEARANELVVESGSERTVDTDDGANDCLRVARHHVGDDRRLRVLRRRELRGGGRDPIAEVFHPPEVAPAESSHGRPA